MLNKIETIKKKGMRYYEVSNSFLNELDNNFKERFAYDIYSDKLVNPIIEIGYKDEKRLKDTYKAYAYKKALAKYNTKIEDFNNNITIDNNYTKHLSMNRIGLITGSNTPFDNKGKPIYTFNKYVASKVMEQIIKEFSYSDSLFQLEVLRTNNDEANKIINGEFTQGNELMVRGNELEDEAVNLSLSLLPIKNKPLVNIFYYNSRYKIGATPDGVFIDYEGEKCVIEVKSPALNTFIQHLTEKHLIKEYYQQLQIEMLLTGAKCAYLVVYYPNFELVIDKVERDNIFLANAMETLELFNKKYEEYYNNISQQYIGM